MFTDRKPKKRGGDYPKVKVPMIRWGNFLCQKYENNEYLPVLWLWDEIDPEQILTTTIENSDFSDLILSGDTIFFQYGYNPKFNWHFIQDSKLRLGRIEKLIDDSIEVFYSDCDCEICKFENLNIIASVGAIIRSTVKKE